MMRGGRLLAALGVAAALAAAAPVANVAAADQDVDEVVNHWELPMPMRAPALQSVVVQGAERMYPADAIEGAVVQFLPLTEDQYLVTHPALYWRVQDAPAAEALAQELALSAPGWDTTVQQGPYGYGAYLTYAPPES